jgi:hypothetical protein
MMKEMIKPADKPAGQCESLLLFVCVENQGLAALARS